MRLSGTLHATLSGQRMGTSVSFRKIYDDLRMGHYPIDYDGEVSPDGSEIEGRWAIPGSWSGTFLMVREKRSQEAAEEKEAVELRL